MDSLIEKIGTRDCYYRVIGMEGPLPECARADIQVDAVTSPSRNSLVEDRTDQLAALIADRF